MSCYQHTPYSAMPIGFVASPTWSESDSSSNASSETTVSTDEEELGYNSAPSSTDLRVVRKDGAEAVLRADGEVEAAGERPLPPIPHSYHPGECKDKFLENQVASGMKFTEGEVMMVLSSPSYLCKFEGLCAADSFSPYLFDEDAKNLIEFLEPCLKECDDFLTQHLVDLMLPHAATLWRKLEVSNYLIVFFYFLGKLDCTLPLQLALLPHLKEMMNHPHGNTTARGLLLHGHTALEPMVRSMMREESTMALLQERERYGFYVLRWYHQYNQAWMEAECPQLAVAISEMSRKAQCSSQGRRY